MQARWGDSIETVARLHTWYTRPEGNVTFSGRFSPHDASQRSVLSGPGGFLGAFSAPAGALHHTMHSGTPTAGNTESEHHTGHDEIMKLLEH